MNIEKIEINGHYVWIDKDTKIKEGDVVINNLDCLIGKSIRPLSDDEIKDKEYSKIIAASPELNLEGVPTYLEWLAKQCVSEYNEQYIKVWRDGFADVLKELQPEQRIKDLEKRLYDCSKANADLIGKINELPTWDDVRKAIDMARNQYWDVDNRGFSTHTDGDWSFKHSEEEIIEQLKQDKL